MGAYVFPVDAVAGAPSYTGRMLRQTLAVTSPGATAVRPLGGLSGVRRGSGTPISVTSTSVSVGPHAGQLDLETALQASVYYYSFDTAQNRTIGAATSNPRIDIVCVVLSDPAESDGTSTPGVDVVVTPGTPAASPTQPATPARSMLIGVINVPATGGGSPTVSWVAPVLPGNAVYGASLVNNTSVTTAGPINLTNVLTIPAVAYATILDISYGAVITAQNASTDVVEIGVVVNSSTVRAVRSSGTVFSLDGEMKLAVAANTSTTLQIQATKTAGSGASTLPNDSIRRWLECMVVPS